MYTAPATTVPPADTSAADVPPADVPADVPLVAEATLAVESPFAARAAEAVALADVSADSVSKLAASP